MQQMHWNSGMGQLAPGVLNAIKATDGAVRLAKANGIGCVALANTNHWMRGGYYGWRAAENNCVFLDGQILLPTCRPGEL
jgi:LDH2 family malate/lactate/ureidoglycolate dehydrogenase